MEEQEWCARNAGKQPYCSLVCSVTDHCCCLRSRRAVYTGFSTSVAAKHEGRYYTDCNPRAAYRPLLCTAMLGSSTRSREHAAQQGPTRSKSTGRSGEGSNSRSRSKQGAASPPYRDIIDKLDLSGLGGGCKCRVACCCGWVAAGAVADGLRLPAGRTYRKPAWQPRRRKLLTLLHTRAYALHRALAWFSI